MAQFCVYRAGTARMLIDLQSDLLDTPTRVVAPLIPLSERPKPKRILEPVFDIAGTTFVMVTSELGAVPTALVSHKPVTDLTARDYDIRRALDLVFSGF